ncbi:hypothetical protein [Archangium violaceum]|uniref:Uncharacterized protein n=1 Tax=Archangium violaceum Cb vi76 TaxID=1406225 RepID=A0A084SND3_9BACT|nr:hypothetical protein [Archangium violaceum]KFA89968.1 hypothetical protein Q664_31500 [Archangium violaceum Cb vi76]
MPTRRKKKAPEETNAPEESKPPEESEENVPEEPEETGPKVVSLNRELSVIGLSVRCAQIAATMEAHGFMDEDMKADSPHGVSSVLALVGARLDLLQAVIRREVNPAVLWGSHNAVGEHEARVDEDVLLTEWNRA